jgi:hypothetical protein
VVRTAGVSGLLVVAPGHGQDVGQLVRGRLDARGADINELQHEEPLCLATATCAVAGKEKVNAALTICLI